MSEGRTDTERVARNYDRMSGWYGAVAASSERKLRQAALEFLDPKQGEILLEIGFGTGEGLVELGRLVGDSGRVFGVEISGRMLELARKRCSRAGLGRRISTQLTDGCALPYAAGQFDGIFMSFVLEVLAPPQEVLLLQECRRVLKRGGRLCTVAMSSQGKWGGMMKLYAWAHRSFPKVIDCRPIRAAELLQSAGFAVRERRLVRFWGLSTETVLCTM